MAELSLLFNGEKKAVTSSTVAELLREFHLEGKKVAVERNREIVPRSEYETTALQENDSIEIVHFVGGG